jgi:hypothetical protein
MISKPARFKTKSSLKDVVITQAIAMAIFVGVPILLTLVAPLSKLHFQHTETGAAVDVVRYVLIFLPWRTEKIENVHSIRADTTAEKRYQGTSEERRKGQKGIRFATGQLAILSDGPEVIVQSDPDLAKKIAKEFDEFAADPTAAPVTYHVFAAWTLSYLLGGIATAFCALYIVGALIAIIMYPIKRFNISDK